MILNCLYLYVKTDIDEMIGKTAMQLREVPKSVDNLEGKAV